MSTFAATKPMALVAEDDRVLADIIRLALTRAGFDVTVAKDGRTALQHAQSRCFQVVTSDYQMPHLNGEQLLRALRAGSASSQATLILCSAKAYELDSERLRNELDLTAVLYKPFSLNELVESAKSALATAAAE